MHREAEVWRRRGKEENLGLELGMSVRGAKKKIYTGRSRPLCILCGSEPRRVSPWGWGLCLEFRSLHGTFTFCPGLRMQTGIRTSPCL